MLSTYTSSSYRCESRHRAHIILKSGCFLGRLPTKDMFPDIFTMEVGYFSELFVTEHIRPEHVTLRG